MNKGAVLILVICVVGLIGYFSLTGFFIQTAEDISADNVAQSATLWLNTEQGRENFPGGMIETPIPVYIGNTTEILYWYTPVKNNEGLYIGLILSTEIEFTTPNSILRFTEPRDFLFLTSSGNIPVSEESAYSQMIEEHPNYSAGQITKPRMVAKGGGLYWMSQVFDGGDLIDEIYVGIRSY